MKLIYLPFLLSTLPSMISAKSLRANTVDQEDDGTGVTSSRSLSGLVDNVYEGDMVTSIVDYDPDLDVASEGAPALFEGDIVPTVNYIMENYGEDFEKKLEEEGKITHDMGDGKGSITMKKYEPLHGTQTFNLWDTRVNDVIEVPWAFASGQFTATQRASITGWIDEMARESGVIKFVPYDGSQSTHIEVQNGSSGCWSYVGKVFTGAQALNLANGCVTKGVTQHEFLHALGFSHEQSRPDRDNYVTILFDNIQSGRENNFAKRTSSDSLGSPYDFGSVMHYGAYAFSSNGQKTIQTNNNESIGQRAGASALDIEQIRLMYQCSTGPRTLTAYNQDKCSSTCPCWNGESGCSSNDECQGGATCSSGICTLGPTDPPTFMPTTLPPSSQPITLFPTTPGEVCYDLTFSTTDNDGRGGQAPNGRFSIDGYGRLPTSCHDTLTSSCNIRFCTKTGVMKLRAESTDGWRFTITGDIGDLLEYNTVPGGTHEPPFPTFMDTDQFDDYQMYEVVKVVTPTTSALPSSAPTVRPPITQEPSQQPSSSPSASPSITTSASPSITPTLSNAPTVITDSPSSSPTGEEICYSLTFMTVDDNSSGEQAPNGIFTIDGYGTIPKFCHETLTSSCTLQICSTRGSMIMRAGSTDGWKFTITGDIGELLDYKTVQGGYHRPPFPTWMDTDQFDYYQEYALVKKPPQPSSSPSDSASSVPSYSPSDSASSVPTNSPSDSASSVPTNSPSDSASSVPSSAPSGGVASSAPSSAPSIDDGSFKIRSTSTSFCLVPKKLVGGQRIILKNCDQGDDSMKWTIEPNGRIRNVKKTNFCLKKNGIRLQIAACKSANAFKFDHSSINGKLYLIKNGITVVGYSGVAADGTHTVFKKRTHHGADESWELV